MTALNEHPKGSSTVASSLKVSTGKTKAETATSTAECTRQAQDNKSSANYSLILNRSGEMDTKKPAEVTSPFLQDFPEGLTSGCFLK